MWTPADRALVGNYGSGQALSDDRYRLLEPLIPPARSGGRPRATDMRRLLESVFYLLRIGCQCAERLQHVLDVVRQPDSNNTEHN